MYVYVHLYYLPLQCVFFFVWFVDLVGWLFSSEAKYRDHIQKVTTQQWYKGDHNCIKLYNGSLEKGFAE